MKAVRILSVSALLLAMAVPSFAQTILRAPGTYAVNVAIDTSILPIPVPGTPALGPNVYSGTLTIRETGALVEARFLGNEISTGDPLTIKARFDNFWIGVTTATVVVDGQVVQNAAVGLDGASLLIMKIDGTGLVDGVTGRLQAELGPGPTLIRWRVL